MGKLSKAKKLTETEKFCIEGMLNNGMEIEKISKALGRDAKLIENLIEEYDKEVNSGPMTINETASGNKGVTVMTEAASYNVDAAKQRVLPPSEKIKGTVHKIHD